MKTIQNINDIRDIVTAHKANGQTIGLVPTMGNLHLGHLSLIANIKNHCDIIITSIFVNPLQFSKNEDFTTYPNTLKNDTKKLTQAGCDYLFLPSVEEIYPQGGISNTLVSIPSLDNILCGASRQGHLTGVATIIAKLLNIIQPENAIFGNKDYQQLMVIKQLVADLNIPTNIIGATTIRDQNGLALSSRNGYLSPEQHEIAARLHQILLIVKQSILSGEKNYREIEKPNQNDNQRVWI